MQSAINITTNTLDILNRYYNFNGTSDYVALPTIPAFGTGDFTVVMKVKFTIPFSDSYDCLLSSYVPDYSIALYVYYSETIRLTLSNTTGTESESVLLPNLLLEINDGETHTIGIIVDRTGYADSYCDGLLKDHVLITLPTTTILNGTNLNLGYLSWINRLFSGSISMCRIFNYALSSTQIANYSKPEYPIELVDLSGNCLLDLNTEGMTAATWLDLTNSLTATVSDAILITPIENVRLDVNADASLELQMGGMNLLDLSARVLSYTNSFVLPKTPVNETQFAYASQTTRSNQPVLDVFVSVGMFNQRGKLIAISFEGGYNCTISYSDFNEKVKALLLNTLIGDVTNPIVTGTEGGFVYLTESENWTLLYSLQTDVYDETPTLLNAQLSEQGAWINIKYFIDLLLTNLGYTLHTMGDPEVDDTMLDILSYNFLFLRDWYYQFEYTTGGASEFNLTRVSVDTTALLCSDILKGICQLTGSYFDVDENTKVVTFHKLETQLTLTPVLYEGLTFKIKNLYSGNGLTNQINYSVDNSLSPITLGDNFTGDGKGIKEVLKLAAVIPKQGTSASDTTPILRYDLRGNNSIVFGQRTTHTTYGRNYLFATSSIILINDYDMAIQDMAGFYSFLTAIFSELVYIRAEGYIDKYTADLLMKTKLIKSVKLGGIYYVNTMNYNLVTNNAVLELIKI